MQFSRTNVFFKFFIFVNLKWKTYHLFRSRHWIKDGGKGSDSVLLTKYFPEVRLETLSLITDLQRCWREGGERVSASNSSMMAGSTLKLFISAAFTVRTWAIGTPAISTNLTISPLPCFAAQNKGQRSAEGWRLYRALPWTINILMIMELTRYIRAARSGEHRKRSGRLTLAPFAIRYSTKSGICKSAATLRAVWPWPSGQSMSAPWSIRVTIPSKKCRRQAVITGGSTRPRWSLLIMFRSMRLARSLCRMNKWKMSKCFLYSASDKGVMSLMWKFRSKSG